MLIALATALAGSLYIPGDPMFGGYGLESSSDVMRATRHALEHDRSGVERTVWLERKGERVQVWPRVPGSPRLGDLPDGALWGVLLGASENAAPARERDLLVPGKDDRLRPVSVWLDGTGGTTVAAGVTAPVLAGQFSVPGLEKAYGIDLVSEGGRNFNPLLLAALDRALSLLTPEERKAVEGLQIVRLPSEQRLLRESHVTGGVPWVTYLEFELYGRIEVFEDPPTSTTWFAGGVEAPEHPLVFELLHHLGHAVAGAERRRLGKELHERREAHVARYTELDARHATLSAGRLAPREALAFEADLEAHEAEGKALDALVDTIANTPWAPADALTKAAGDTQEASPTPYGGKVAVEAYAEAFALYHADPAALGRTAPAAFAWFEGGGL